MKIKKTLYECSHARVQGRRIYCNRGYPLSQKSGDGSLDIKRLAEGEPLALNICQPCPDFDCMGPPLPDEKRGWLKGKEVTKYGATTRETLREIVARGRRQTMD
jgi:hypothetical protein